MERWSSIDQEDIHLATIRVYHNAKSSTGKAPRIVLILPPNPDNPAGDEYEMDMVNESVENQIVVAEREKAPGTGNRARTTILTGRVKHECNLRPVFTDRYRQRLKERSRAANLPARQIMRIEDAHPGGRGGINMLTSGVANAAPFNLVVCSYLFQFVLPADRFMTARKPSRNHQKGSSSAWLVCRATSYWTSFSMHSRSGNAGRSRCFANVHSSPRHI